MKVDVFYFNRLRVSLSNWRDYGSASSPAFIIDRQGRIVLRQVWINPTELDETLAQLLVINAAAVGLNR